MQKLPEPIFTGSALLDRWNHNELVGVQRKKCYKWKTWKCLPISLQTIMTLFSSFCGIVITVSINSLLFCPHCCFSKASLSTSCPLSLSTLFYSFTASSALIDSSWMGQGVLHKMWHICFAFKKKKTCNFLKLSFFLVSWISCELRFMTWLKI